MDKLILWTFAEFRANRTLKVKMDHPRRLHLRLRSHLQGWLRLLCGKVWQCHPLTTRSWVIQCDSFRVGFATSPCSAFGASSSRGGYPNATRDKRRLQRPRLTQVHTMWDDGEMGPSSFCKSMMTGRCPTCRAVALLLKIRRKPVGVKLLHVVVVTP